MVRNLHVRDIPKEEDDPLVLNSSQAPKFTRIVGSFGWLDPHGDDTRNRHCFLVGGQQVDGRYSVFEETLGGMSAILTAATNAKDRYLITEIWCDNSDPDIMGEVYKWDGLTKYESLGTDPLGQELWKTPASSYPHFRSRDQVAIVGGVPGFVRASLTGSVNKLDIMLTSKQLSIHGLLAYAQWVLDQPRPSDVESHPVYTALVYLVWGLTKEPFVRQKEETTWRNPYPNLK